MSLSKNIKRLRIEKKMTQEQLASLLGVSSQAISKWENYDTYPDGSLLLPLSKILGVSLDELFGNEEVYLDDMLKKAERLMMTSKEEEQLNIARKIGWHIEHGIFNSYCMQYTSIRELDINDLDTRTAPSFILNDHGFTYFANGDTPFFSVFIEPKCGFEILSDEADQLKSIFSSLASPDTLQAILYLCKQKSGYTFEASALAEVTGIDKDKIDDVMHDLEVLNSVSKTELIINGEKRALYSIGYIHKLLSVFLTARELCYAGGYCVKVIRRSLPLIK